MKLYWLQQSEVQKFSFFILTPNGEFKRWEVLKCLVFQRNLEGCFSQGLITETFYLILSQEGFKGLFNFELYSKESELSAEDFEMFSWYMKDWVILKNCIHTSK